MNENKPIRLGGVFDNETKHQAGSVWDKENISPTIDTMQGGWRQPMIIEDFYKNREPRVYDETAPTIRAEREGLKVIEEQPVIIGGMQKNQSVKTDGICTTLTSSMGTGGGYVPMVVASRGRNKENPSDRTQGIELEQRLEPNSEGICNTLTSVQKDNLVLEPAILTPKRTEYGKAIRKDYENGSIQESRHNMTELQPREDGVSNTLTTVQKDNLVLEPKLVGGIGEKNWGKQYRQGNRVYDSEAVAMALNASPVGNTGGNSYLYKTDYRIRKLTPKECWRLMGFTDEDFHKAEQVNSNSQLYKQAGNSIVVEVLEETFKQMF